MRANMRATIGYIAIRLVSNQEVSSIYDQSQGTFLRIEGTITNSHIQVYDYESNCRIDGNKNGDTFFLHHHGEGYNVELIINGSELSGYDYCTSNRFTGSVSGHSVQIYDFDSGSYHHYNL